MSGIWIIIWTILTDTYPRYIPTKFEENPVSGFGEDVEMCLTNFANYIVTYKEGQLKWLCEQTWLSQGTSPLNFNLKRIHWQPAVLEKWKCELFTDRWWWWRMNDHKISSAELKNKKIIALMGPLYPHQVWREYGQCFWRKVENVIVNRWTRQWKMEWWTMTYIIQDQLVVHNSRAKSQRKI